MAPPERSEEARSALRLKGVYCYLVTIKRVSMQFTPRAWLLDHLFRLRRTIKKAEWSDCVVFELDGLDRLHLHTIVQVNSKLYLKGLQRKGWTIHFQPFPKSDYPRVLNYLHKVDQHPAHIDQMESESYTYLSKDPFIEE